MDNNSRHVSIILYPFIIIYDVFKYFVNGIISIIKLFAMPFIKKNKTVKPEVKKVSMPTITQEAKPISAAINENKTAPSLSVNLKDKKAIIKERQERHRKEEAERKKQLNLRKKESAKMELEKQLLQSDLASGDVKRTDKPVAFRYKAIDPNGKIVKGTFTGSSKLDVNAFLVNEGYDVYSIETSSWINFLYGQSSFGTAKMSKKDLVFWLTQLYTYVKSGIPLTDAVKILSNQMGRNGSRKKIFEKIIYELTMGSSFSDALAKQGNVFPSLLINMLKAAEATGELEETLKDMADYYNELEKTRKQMVSAMTYPAIITVFSLGVISFILLYVIPQFTKVYDQAGIKINGFTLAIIHTSNFLKNNISILLLAIIAIVGTLVLAYKKIKAFRKNIQILLMHIPVIKNVITYNEMTIFAKTFSSLLKNNVFITESIEILSKVTNNEIYKEIMYNTINNIAKGEKISESFKDHWAIPDVAYYMIVTGESTGELAAMMENVSNYFQEQHKNIVTSLKSFIEPIMITLLAVIVGAIIMAVIIPMFSLYGSIST